MPAISYNDWSGGLDRRLPINVQESSRLWTLDNAFITTGKRIKKRPGLVRDTTGDFRRAGVETSVSGMFTNDGSLVVFAEVGGSYVDLPDIALPQVLTSPGGTLLGIQQCFRFQGFLYVVAVYAGLANPYRHHYIDGSPSTLITDANCPQSAHVTVAESRVYAINGETVRYCAAGDARDWTTPNDAGFLPVALQQNTKANCTAVGTFEDALVVFFAESAQIWDVAVDPSANAFRKRLAIGTSDPLTLANFGNDLVFLSPYGFRTLTVTSQTDRIDDTDIGVPVDDLVVATRAVSNGVFGQWIPQFGQYWCVFPGVAVGEFTGTVVWSYGYSRSSKLACWSRYTFNFQISNIATVAGKVYVRSSVFPYRLYSVSPTQYSDDSATTTDVEAIPVEVQMAFQDAKSPSVLKQFYGSDYVMQGSPEVAFKYDPRDQDKESVPLTISGDTRPGEITPVEICATAIAPVFRHSANEAFELDALTLMFESLGLT